MVRQLAGRLTSSLGRSFTSSRSQGQKTEPKMSSGILGLLVSAVSQNSAKLYLIQFSLGSQRNGSTQDLLWPNS